MKLSVGVDLHKGQFTVYWRSESEEIRGWEKYSTTETGYEGFEQKLTSLCDAGYEAKVAVESTGNTRYFKNRIERLGVPVVVINTLKFKVVTESVKKTDRHDAETIAEFLEKDMLPEARLCSEKSEELRRVLKTRSVLVRSIVSVKNQIHGMLLGMGIEIRRSALQSKKARRRVLNVLAEQNLTGAAAVPLMETIDQLNDQVKRLEKLIAELVVGDRVVELIMSIPGAGLITAATIRAYTDDVSRYHGPKQYAAYAGLVPWVQDSNQTERHGRITKHGSEELRTALIQIVMGMVRAKRHTEKYWLMKRYAMLKGRKGSGRSIVATARKLSTIIWHMLTNDEEFDPSRMMNLGIHQTAMEMQAAASDAA